MILVVDDDPSVTRFITVVPSPGGHRIEIAQDLETGLRSLVAKPAVLITDLSLSGESGIPLVASAAALEPRPGIVAISGAGARALDRATEAGADRVFDKPFSPVLFRDGVEELLTHLQSAGSRGGTSRKLPPGKPVARVTSVDHLAIVRARGRGRYDAVGS